MDISDADMIMAADRGERLYRARRAQALLRGARAARAPMSRYAPPTPRVRILAGPRFQRAYASRASYGFSGREIKSFDQIVSNAGPNYWTTAPNVLGAEPNVFTGLTEINLVRQGATFYNRIGNQITVKSIACSFGIVQDSLSNTGHTWRWRYMIVYDRQPNGAFPGITDIISDNDTGACTFDSGITIANKSRFTILRDRRGVIDDAGVAAVQVNEYIKCNLSVEYKANGGTIGDISTGAIYLICFADFNGGAGLRLQFMPTSAQGATTRIRYSDN